MSDMDNKSYSFVYIPDRVCKALEERETKDHLMKWSLKGNLEVKYYSFNQPFHYHKKEEFVQAFFSDPVVYTTLVYNQAPIGEAAASAALQVIPCTILSMEFFDRLLDPKNGIVRCDGKSIVQCQEDDIEGFMIDDNLRNMILNENSKYYSLYSESERKQFLWKIFCHLCLGGEYCQYEFSIESYLKTAKNLYKDLVSVERIGDSSELVVRSIVLKVQTFDENMKPLTPFKPQICQDFVYLIIDPFKRSVSVMSHSYGGTFCV